jgi:hypothetical protein
VHRGDDPTTFMCRVSINLGALTSWTPIGHVGLERVALPLYLLSPANKTVSKNSEHFCKCFCVNYLQLCDFLTNQSLLFSGLPLLDGVLFVYNCLCSLCSVLLCGN